jgi:selenocysteine lyase/cysteine desulfurase
MLIPRTEFIGLEGVTHLCAGGESPMLRSHRDVVARFFADKALGETSRELLEETYQRCKGKVSQLLGGNAEDYAFLSSSSEGVNLIAHALDWQRGDNVVICDVEFPSEVLPWTPLQSQGVEIRIVAHQEWSIQLEDIRAAIDARTRVVAVSHVSYFTGQRLSLATLSEIVRPTNALLLVDATHSAGVLPVEASYADILVSSCYKWLLGVHGVAIFYWNRERLPQLEPPFLGWNTGETLPDWQAPTSVQLRADADRFVPGNPSFISVYVLENALDRILEVGVSNIARHVLSLSGKVWKGLNEDGWELMTPKEPDGRAGNVCFIAEDIGGITSGLAANGVRIWGGYGGVGRIRVSTHLYNSDEDVERFFTVLRSIVP